MSARDAAVQAQDDAAYICARVIDALLREDVRGCVSGARIVESGAFAEGRDFPATQRWLEIGHWGDGRVWIPVVPERFMQSWRLARLPLLAEQDGTVRALTGLHAILARCAAGTDADTRSRFAAFEEECGVAIAHRAAAESARRAWFGSDAPEPISGPWHQQMLRHDRLASYLDHPLYPTARAKLGFAVEDLRRYAPEFSQPFALHWLAVPRALVHGRDEQLPPGWPAFPEVGLPQQLAADHVLVPVHPFVWHGELAAMLAGAGLADRVIRAPRTHMVVRPTLSVRSLALEHAPEWHVKLPLTIRTLGARNIRTIKPSTIHDGQLVQDLLAAIAAREPWLAGRLLLTREDTGAHVDGRTFLGYIVRRYPAADLEESVPVPVAGLLAAAPEGGCVAEQLALRFYDGDLLALFQDYLELTLRLHLTLWLRYGIALESNQQNSVLVLSGGERPRLRLLLKDNDAARLWPARLERVSGPLAAKLADLQDARLRVDGELPLAQMFTTITLQLNLAVPIEGLARRVPGFRRDAAYARVRQCIEAILADCAAGGADIALARQVLLQADHLPVKYLLTAATLLDKQVTGAADVNKFYGQSAPNFLKPQP